MFQLSGKHPCRLLFPISNYKLVVNKFPANVGNLWPSLFGGGPYTEWGLYNMEFKRRLLKVSGGYFVFISISFDIRVNDNEKKTLL